MTMGSTSTTSADSISIKEVVVRSFHLKVNYATNLQENLWESPNFHCGGHDWSIFCTSAEEVVFLALKLESKARGVKTTFELSLLDKDGNPSVNAGAFKRASHTFSYENENPPCLLFVPRNVLEEEYLVDGCFVVLCTIFVAAELAGELPLREDLDNVSKSRSSQEMADLIFEVDGEIFRVHEEVIVAKSHVFRTELELMARGRTERVKIEDMKAVVFKCLLRYMYTGLVEDNNLAIIHDLLAVADRYEVKGLRIMCEERLCKNVSLHTIMNSLPFAYEHHCNRLLDACLDFAADIENYVALSLTDKYLQLMQNCPNVFSELRKRVIRSGGFKQLIEKKQRTE